MSTPMLVADRLEWLEKARFGIGKHSSIVNGCCVMEAVAYVAGEPHSDHPQCTCPIITAFMIGWNDSLPSNQDRDRLLKPIVPLIVGTRSDSVAEQKRGFLCIDWFIRTFVPAWLQLVPSLQIHAETLRKYPEITDVAVLMAVTPVLTDIAKSSAAASDAASDAAWAAALAAASDAAWAAAWAAALAAASDAALAAALAAASDAALAAASDAARAAARAALKPTVQKLQESATDLVHRMIAVK